MYAMVQRSDQGQRSSDPSRPHSGADLLPGERAGYPHTTTLFTAWCRGHFDRTVLQTASRGNA